VQLGERTPANERPQPPRLPLPLAMPFVRGNSNRPLSSSPWFFGEPRPLPDRAYTKSHWLELVRPLALSDGHDLPGSVDKGIPGVAAVIDDIVVGFEDAVREPVFAHILPNIFDRIEFRAFRWQRDNGDIGGNH
jgi:hypothetical protein